MKTLTLLLLLFSFSSFAQKKEANEVFYEIKFSCRYEDGNRKNIVVNYFEIINGTKTRIKTIKNGRQQSFLFEYNKEYLVDFEKPGYITKSISVNTKDIPKSRRLEGFSKFEIEVRLQSQPKDSAIKYSQPITNIRYYDFIEDFEYNSNSPKLNKNINEHLVNSLLLNDTIELKVNISDFGEFGGHSEYLKFYRLNDSLFVNYIIKPAMLSHNRKDNETIKKETKTITKMVQASEIDNLNYFFKTLQEYEYPTQMWSNGYNYFEVKINNTILLNTKCDTLGKYKYIQTMLSNN